MLFHGLLIEIGEQAVAIHAQLDAVDAPVHVPAVVKPFRRAHDGVPIAADVAVIHHQFPVGFQYHRVAGTPLSAAVGQIIGQEAVVCVAVQVFRQQLIGFFPGMLTVRRPAEHAGELRLRKPCIRKANHNGATAHHSLHILARIFVWKAHRAGILIKGPGRCFGDGHHILSTAAVPVEMIVEILITGPEISLYICKCTRRQQHQHSQRKQASLFHVQPSHPHEIKGAPSYAPKTSAAFFIFSITGTSKGQRFSHAPQPMHSPALAESTA